MDHLDRVYLWTNISHFLHFFLKSASRFLNFFGGRFRDVSPLNSDFWGVDCLVDWNVRADETLFSVGLQLSWNMLSYWQQFQAPPFGFHKFEIVNASKSFWISKIRNLVVFFILKVEGQGLLLIWKAPPAIRMASPKIHPHEKLHGTMTSPKKNTDRILGCFLFKRWVVSDCFEKAASTRESRMILLKKGPWQFTGFFGDAHVFLRKSEKMIILSSGHISYFKEKVQPLSASATWLGVHWEMWWGKRWIRPWKIKMEPENDPIEKEIHLPKPPMFGSHVNFQGCTSNQAKFLDAKMVKWQPFWVVCLELFLLVISWILLQG